MDYLKALNYPAKMDTNLGPVKGYAGIGSWDAYNLSSMDRYGRLLSRAGLQADCDPQEMLPTPCDSGVTGGRQTNISPTVGDVTASWDVPIVYIIIEQLQLRIRDIEEELTRLRAKTCYCQDEGHINRRTDTANAATQHESAELQDGNTDRNQNDYTTETSEKMTMSQSVDQSSLPEQNKVHAISRQSNEACEATQSLNLQDDRRQASAPQAAERVHSKKKVCTHCGGMHPITACNDFKSLSLDDRWKRARQLNLCFRCLSQRTRSSGHLGRNCPNTEICGIKHCKLSHSRLLHDEHRRQLIWYSRYDTRSTQPPSDRSWNQVTKLKSTVKNEASLFVPEPPSGRKGACMDTLDTFSELSATSEPSSDESAKSYNVNTSVPPSEELGTPIQTLAEFEFPAPPSEDIADRLRERFKGKHRKYWSCLLRETEREISYLQT